MSFLCRSLKELLSWQIRRSTSDSTDQTRPSTALNDDDDNPLFAAATNYRNDHVEKIHIASSSLVEKVLVAREEIQSTFHTYAKIHRQHRNEKHTATAVNNAEVDDAKAQNAALVRHIENLFKDNRVEEGETREHLGESEDHDSAEHETVNQTNHHHPSNSSVAPRISVMPDMDTVTALAGGTAMSRRNQRGMHIENVGIEKCCDNVLSHCSDIGRLENLKAIKNGLETHVLYQNSFLLLARNILLSKPNVKITIPSLDSIREEEERKNISTQYVDYTKVLGVLPSPPPQPPLTAIPLDKIKIGQHKEFGINQEGKEEKSLFDDSLPDQKPPKGAQSSMEDNRDENYKTTAKEYARTVS